MHVARRLAVVAEDHGAARAERGNAMSVLALINISRNPFQNKVGGQKSAFFEISIEIKSAQPVSCSQASSFDRWCLAQAALLRAADELVGRRLVQATLMLNYNKRSVG